MNSIDIANVMKEVESPESGATSLFIGTTRNVSRGRSVDILEYEAYEPMALGLMEGLEREARKRWPVNKVALVHRLGRVAVGEASVVIAVSCGHRKEAFEACRFLIDELKKNVPIWKREFFSDGTMEWSGTPAGMVEGTNRG